MAEYGVIHKFICYKACQLKKAKELEEQQERELIDSSEFANNFAHVVNSNVGISLPVTANEVQEDLITLDEVTIIERCYSSAVLEESVSANGARNKLQVIKNKSMPNQNAPVTTKQGPSAWEQKSQHLAGTDMPTSSAPGVVVGGKKFVQVSQLEEAMLKKRKV